jgi:hypothetical protein
MAVDVGGDVMKNSEVELRLIRRERKGREAGTWVSPVNTKKERTSMLGCGCLFALGAAFFPRLAVLFVWLFTPLVERAFTMVIWPILGIIFLPFTTLMYVLVYNPVVGVTGWGWLWVIVGLLLDISSYGGSAYSNRNRMPGYSAS